MAYQRPDSEFPIHSRMASLDEEIAVLKAEIEGYKLELKDATITESRYDKLLDLIKSTSDCLTELEKRRNAQAAGNPICFDQ